MACIGTAGVEARLVSPSLRRVNPYYIVPLELALYPDGNPHHTVNIRNAIPLDTDEALESWINSAPVGAEQASTVVWLAPGALTPITGRMYTVNFEITLALVAGAWAFSELDFVDELPVGTYDLVGARVEVDTAVAFRFVPVGAAHRPGAPCLCNCEYDNDPTFRYGGMGSWFVFSTVQPPGVEVLSSAAAVSATYQGYMDIIPR